MLKKSVLVLSFCMLILFNFASVGAIDMSEAFDALPEEIRRELPAEYNQIDSPDQLIGDISFAKIGSKLQSAVQKLLPEFAQMLTHLLAYVLLLSVLRYFTFEKTKNGYTFVIVCFADAALMLYLYRYFAKSCETIAHNIETMHIFCDASVPALTALLISSGKTFRAALFSYAVDLCGLLVSSLSGSVFLPLTQIYLAVGCCGQLWENSNYTAITELIKKFIKWSIGIIFTIFSFTITVQNILSGASDGIAKKAVKAAAGTIPVLGGAMSQGIDGIYTLLTGTGTTVAIIGILSILAIFCGPCLLLGLQVVAVSIGEAAAGLFGQNECTSILKVFKEAYQLMLGLFCVSMLMCIVCFLVVCIGAS